MKHQTSRKRQTQNSSTAAPSFSESEGQSEASHAIPPSNQIHWTNSEDQSEARLVIPPSNHSHWTEKEGHSEARLAIPPSNHSHRTEKEGHSEARLAIPPSNHSHWTDIRAAATTTPQSRADCKVGQRLAVISV